MSAMKFELSHKKTKPLKQLKPQISQIMQIKTLKTIIIIEEQKHSHEHTNGCKNIKVLSVLFFPFISFNSLLICFYFCDICGKRNIYEIQK